MSSKTNEQKTIELGTVRIQYTVNRGERRRSRLVISPDGKVDVRVPPNVADEWVKEYVYRQRRWILRQLLYFERFRPREPERRYVPGETFRYLGRQYRLAVTEANSDDVKLRGRHLMVSIPDFDPSSIRKAVQQWYIDRARIVFARRAPMVFEKLRPHGIAQHPIELRKMKRRWGSCTPRNRILLNPFLVIAPTDCIDYVLTHELCHTRHSQHNQAFYNLLTTVMPDWPRRRNRLERYGPCLTL